VWGSGVRAKPVTWDQVASVSAQMFSTCVFVH